MTDPKQVLGARVQDALVAAFGADYWQAREPLDRLRGIAARMVLPGHGDAFTGGVDEAVRLAREAPFPG